MKSLSINHTDTGGIMIHKASLRLLTICCILFAGISISSAYAANWEESAKLSTIFKNSGMNGTFVLYDVTAHKHIGHDKNRAESRFVPASTFKIPNSLIGLSVGAVKSVDEIIPYKGDSQPFIKAWAKDMGLREAIALSNVPIYQELARRIGFERMRDGIERLNYGSKQIGTTVDTFWLAGPLKISAIEQTSFLAKLAQGSLPFPQENQRSVREITLLERGLNWELHGKTGWENAPGKGVGWWVGWVQKNSRIYAFALNIDIEKESDASKRIELGKACLKLLEIL
jgi:beta-lactamase class D